MKIYDNGIYRSATPEEVTAMQQAAVNQPAVPTPEERLAALESAILAMLGNG